MPWTLIAQEIPFVRGEVTTNLLVLLPILTLALPATVISCLAFGALSSRVIITDFAKHDNICQSMFIFRSIIKVNRNSRIFFCPHPVKREYIALLPRLIDFYTFFAWGNFACLRSCLLSIRSFSACVRPSAFCSIFRIVSAA